MTVNKEKCSKNTWMHYSASISPYRCAELIRRNEPVNKTLLNVFSYILENWLLLCKRKEGIHLFINRQIDEIHYMFQSLAPKKSVSPSYNPLKDRNFAEFFLSAELLDLRETDSAPAIKNLDNEVLKTILETIGFEVSDECVDGIIIPFDYDEINLGRFILWGKRQSQTVREGIPHNSLLGWNATWYRFLSDLFKREYSVQKDTYLPSYYSVGWKRAAVLFADIRNFTTLTEMLRNAYSLKQSDRGPLQEIVNEYCAEMSAIIQDQNRGRIDKFMGDGIMALFGEYDTNPSHIVCKAVYVACKMVERFTELKSKWEEMAFGEEYAIEYNESVELDIGIGIDFGTVLFDYFGDDRHREYGVVGDHVNFAQRLESAAAKEDEINTKKRPHIILSRTAFQCCSPWLNTYNEIKISAKGKGHKYTCYGIETDDFNFMLFNLSAQNNNWDSVSKR